jgi:hypothetical protein
MSGTENPSPDAAWEEVEQNPGGWVYKTEGKFSAKEDIPPDAIVGAWKVDDHGKIISDFVPNPNFRRDKRKH